MALARSPRWRHARRRGVAQNRNSPPPLATTASLRHCPLPLSTRSLGHAWRSVLQRQLPPAAARWRLAPGRAQPVQYSMCRPARAPASVERGRGARHRVCVCALRRGGNQSPTSPSPSSRRRAWARGVTIWAQPTQRRRRRAGGGGRRTVPPTHPPPPPPVALCRSFTGPRCSWCRARWEPCRRAICCSCARQRTARLRTASARWCWRWAGTRYRELPC